MNKVVDYYDNNAERLSEIYDSKPFELFHSYIEQFLPSPPARILDVGCGTGRDAIELAHRGYKVVGLDPSLAMLEIAKHKNAFGKVTWVNDSLPKLGKLDPNLKFDCIFCSAVWMHLDNNERPSSLRRLKEFITPTGILYITFRSKEPDPYNIIFSLDKSTFEHEALKEYAIIGKEVEGDQFNRPHLKWYIYILKPLP